jgi:hypothetical protein
VAGSSPLSGWGAGAPLADQPVDRGPDRLQVQAMGDQDPGRRVAALSEQPEEQVLSTEVVKLIRDARLSH